MRRIIPARWRLATRVIAAAIALLTILLVIVVVGYGQSEQERRRAEIDNAASMALAVAGVVDGFARDLETTMLSTAVLLGAQPAELTQANAGEYLHAVFEQYGMLRGYFVTDPEGRVLASASGEGIGLDLSDRPYTVALREGASAVWSPAVVGTETGEVTATFARRIEGPGGELRGHLVAAFYPPRLAERLTGRIPADADVTLIDAQGLVLHSTQRPDLPFEERDLSGSPAAQTALGGETASVDGSVGFFGGESRFGAVVPVPATGWAVAFTRPLGPLEATLRERFLWQAGQITLAVAVVGALLTVATQRIARPLGDLAAAAGAVARGERPSIPVVDDEAEVGQLATAMSTMSAAVAEREDALRRESERRTILADASRAFAEAGLHLDEALDTIARRVAEDLRDACTVWLLTHDGRYLEPRALHHGSPEAFERARVVLLDAPVRPDELLSGRVATTGEVIYLPQVSEDSIRNAVGQREAPISYLERLEVRSFIAVPLRAHGRLIGSLSAWRDTTTRPYSPEDVALLQEIAVRAALAIENARLFAELEEHVAALNRSMRAHEEFLALVSHDLKNPLTTIKATAQIVRRRADGDRALGPEELADAMESIEAAINRATDEVDAALDVARMHLGQPLVLAPQRADLLALLREAAASYQRLTDQHEIVVEAPEDEIVGEWDAARLERAVSNLLSNAIKFSPEGGRVTVRVGLEGDSVVLAVRDEGLGIPAHALPRVFDRFYRAENVVDRIDGTGLGLCGVRYIVEAHGGAVGVESAEGKGSTFTVRLPRTPPSGAAPGHR